MQKITILLTAGLLVLCMGNMPVETPKPGEVYPGEGLEARLAKGILKEKYYRWRGAGGIVGEYKWYECGERYTQDEAIAAAHEWATNIIRASKKYDQNPWGMAGLVAHETDFRRCSIGPHTRNWAYAKRLLKKKKETISHTKEEVLELLGTWQWRKRWGRTGVDLGPAQILYGRYYKGDPKDMMSLNPGLDIVAKEMQMRSKWGRWHNKLAKKRPWGVWPGTYVRQYDIRVTVRARKLGATPSEV